MNPTEALKYYFHYDTFRHGQEEIIENILRGENILAVLPTGAGKSICFQIPALISPNFSIVISPLIALMKDQVDSMNIDQLNASFINSTMDFREIEQVLQNIAYGRIKILYVAPERLENMAFAERIKKLNPEFLFVDEAHCISEWGHNFRPSYSKIKDFINFVGITKISAFTATATPEVVKDIVLQLGFTDPKIFVRGFERENLFINAIVTKKKNEKCIELISRYKTPAIIYCASRKKAEEAADYINFHKIKCSYYHAGLQSEIRKKIQEDFLNDEIQVICATNAFGMGINKKDIRLIIHYNTPGSIENYYQEIGRAGRDGKPAQIILFYALKDRELPEVFIEGGRPSIYKYEKVIRAIKTELLGEREILRRTNFKQTQIRVIKADLIEQGIAREVLNGKSKMLEYIPGAPLLNVQAFEQLRNAKKLELYQMIRYVETDQSRMKFLCEFLGDQSDHKYDNCDNTGLEKKTLIRSPEWMAKVKEFHENYFPELNLEQAGSKLVNGVAASHYGVSNVGSTLHRCKYEHGGDFPDFLVSLCLKAFRKKFGQEQFDLVVYIPPTVSGDLVKNFAEKMARILKFPISHELKKIRPTQEQKVFENFILKAENVKNVFTFIHPELVVGKKVLLIDDICDSGMTIKEIGRFLTRLGAIKILPVVIAKTIGGDLL